MNKFYTFYNFCITMTHLSKQYMDFMERDVKPSTCDV